MNVLREPSQKEKAIVVALLQAKPETADLLDCLDGLLVREMSDGGMGSLSLVPNGLEGIDRSFGRQLLLGEFTDSDGVTVSVALNVDSKGRLYELDVWKVDFSPLLAWPKPSAVRIVG